MWVELECSNFKFWENRQTQFGMRTRFDIIGFIRRFDKCICARTFASETKWCDPCNWRSAEVAADSRSTIALSSCFSVLLTSMHQSIFILIYSVLLKDKTGKEKDKFRAMMFINALKAFRIQTSQSQWLTISTAITN